MKLYYKNDRNIIKAYQMFVNNYPKSVPLCLEPLDANLIEFNSFNKFRNEYRIS